MLSKQQPGAATRSPIGSSGASLKVSALFTSFRLLLTAALLLSPAAYALEEYATGPKIVQDGTIWSFVPLARFSQSVAVLDYDPTPESVRARRAATDEDDEEALRAIPVYWRHILAELELAYVYIDLYARFDPREFRAEITSVQIAPSDPDDCGYCQVLWDRATNQYALVQNIIIVGLNEPELTPEIARIAGADLVDYGEQIATMRAPETRDIYAVYQRLLDMGHLRFVNLGIVR